LGRKPNIRSPERKGSKKQNDAEMFDPFFCQSDHTRQGAACKAKKRTKRPFSGDFSRSAEREALADGF
jgi:hypothetical protein